MRWQALALFLSGVAALIYQVVWTREISLLMGSTVAAVTTVLAVFMGGLGLGSALAARRVDRWEPKAALRFYAALEGGIALFALVFPWLLSAATPLFAGLYRANPDSPAVLATVRFLVAALLLLVPTTLMGATLPALTASLASPVKGLGRISGFLYAANTVGAMVGSLATGVLLLPLVGMRQSSLLAVALNVAAGVLVLFVARSGGDKPATEASERQKSKAATEAPKQRTAKELTVVLTLATIALSGAGALAHEVAWTRTFILLIGPTSYGIAFILTSVIAGIALGSAAMARRADATDRPATVLALVEWGAALSSLVVVKIIGGLPVPLGQTVLENADRMEKLLALEFLWVLGLLIVPSFFFGAAFPIAVRLLAPRVGEPGRAVGLVYAWNTVGAVLGALFSGFVVLPWLGLERTLYAAAATHVAAGAVAFLGSARLLPRWVLASAVAAAFVLAALFLPRWDVELLSGGVYKYASYARPGELLEILRRGELVYYKEGRTATVSIKQVGNELSLAIDGKVDATNAGDMLTQRLLAHVPLLLHANPKDVCVIGLGSGVTAGSVLTHPVERLDAVEISPEVVEAARYFKEANRDVLANPRLNVIVGDGRNHLLLTDRRYDVIISEPSNPWMAGVSGLFTRDFWELARTRLAPGGVFCQWAHIYNMALDDLRTLVAGFTDAFPTATLFVVNESDVLLIGSESPPDGPSYPSLLEISGKMSQDAVRDDLAGVEVRNPYAVASLYALSTPALSDWARSAARHTDDRPLLEFRAPRFIHANTSRDNVAAIRKAAENTPVPEAFARLRARPSGEELSARGSMLEKSESFELAMEVFRDAFNRDPRLLTAYEGFVRAALSLGRTKEAVEELRQRAERDSPVEASVALGLLLNNLGQPQDALGALGRAVSLSPQNVRALLLAAEIQGEQNQVDAMVHLAERALATSPGNAEALAYLAEASLLREDYAEALRRAEAVLSLAPSETQAMAVRAIVRAQSGDRKGARQSFEALVAAEPEAWVHLNNFGRFELQGNDFASAAGLFERAVDVNPKNVTGYQGLLEAARLLGDRKRVERARAMLAYILGEDSTQRRGDAK